MRINKNAKIHIEAGAGKWDSWGFGIAYCNYDHSLAIDFIHWYAYISFWVERKKK